jgi:RNA polymerase sigma-70 factor (ECF subfamily)
MAESDASLVARALEGDAGSFEALLRRHFRAAYVVALALTGERADAEDVCQEAFVRCWERLADCRDPARFVAWLMRIVRNTAHNYRDYLAVRRTEPLGEAIRAGSDVSPALAAGRAELADRLRSALAELAEAQREVVLLHDLEGWRHRDIAAALGISELMSRRHLSDARRTLRALLGDYAALETDHD